MRRLCVLSVLLCSTVAGAETIALWDFSEGTHGWTGNLFVEGLTAGAEGLAFTSTGNDPWIEGPAVDLSSSDMTRITVRMKSNAAAGAELFYGEHFEAGRSVRFTVQNDGQWHDHVLFIKDPLGARTRFRLDPTTGPGRIVIRSITIESIRKIAWPQPAKPKKPDPGDGKPISVTSGPLSVDHFNGWGRFSVRVGGKEIAAGYRSESIGLVLDDKPQWMDLEMAQFSCEGDRDGRRLLCIATLTDSRGGRWGVTRRFSAGETAGSLVVEMEFVVDVDRDVVHLPWLTLFPGLGTYGADKTQALLPGLEYIADEPSSSQADITTPEHVRRVPDPLKITFPLMAVVHEDRYIGLLWEPSEMVAPVFDSPDRIYGSGAHVMALTAPAIGEHRFENDMTAYRPFRVKAFQPVRARAVIIAGQGRTVVPAVKKYVELRGLPDVPQFKGGLDAAVTVLAHGWLDSEVNEDGLFRHAVWGTSFGASPAADVPVYMDWLAGRASDPDLVKRLRAGREVALSKLPSGRPYLSSVSHVRTAAPPLVLGGVRSYVRARVAEADRLLRQFDERGIKRYRPGKADYAKTHFADHANGLAAVDVVRTLEAATLSADPKLIERGLGLLDKQTALYAGTVPRGAQTWEMPLHTPDILASAYLVKAYTLGYIISREPRYLEQARYWAWTGVPFLYLINPTEQEMGPYATIAVLGATNWKAPIWFGQPVQWCGLVYASALHGLSVYDSEGPWERIAKGITATGLQMTWPITDTKRQGLLPDYIHLRAQYRDGPAINPGTVQAHVPELFGQGRLYDVRKLPNSRRFIHAPCAIDDVREEDESVSFSVDGMGANRYFVLISGTEAEPSAVTVRSAHEVKADHQFDAAQRLLIISLTGPGKIELKF